MTQEEINSCAEDYADNESVYISEDEMPYIHQIMKAIEKKTGEFRFCVTAYNDSIYISKEGE